MGMEIERKYLIKELPANLDTYDYHIIEQAYLTTEPTIRVRKEDEKYYMTYKGSGLLSREEYNLPLTEEAYATLKSKADGNIITKKRHLIPYGKYTIELDVFEEPFAPMIVAEVEFPSEDEANSFAAPDWFGTDVTDRPEYKNSYLSRITLT